jgi:2-polyprenyl-6-methoxyphenol hydroxylase-like FAD-dependent oxidoreductase
MGKASSGRVAIIGGGPAGLFLARMIGLLQPGTGIDVYERNGPGVISGFGVELTQRTMHTLARHDPQTHSRITEASMALSRIELRLPGAAALCYDGFPVCAISRHALLSILHEQAEQVGARLHCGYEAVAGELDADIVALAEGAGSAHRTAGCDAFGTDIRTGSARYIWLGTSAGFNGGTAMAFVGTEYGPMAAHCYPYSADMSTVVIETDDATWRNAGFDSSVVPLSGEIDGDALKLLTEIFAGHLGGHRFLSSKSRWGRFPVIRNKRWSHGNLVLLGDAAHTAHFTVGSGTKLALEDGIALARALRGHDDPRRAFAAYERERRGPVTRTQQLAEPSMHWWETYGRRLHMPPAQFGMHFITRSAAISYLGLRRRCAETIDGAEVAYCRAAGVEPALPLRNAVTVPLQLGGTRLPHRLVTVLPDRGLAGQPEACPIPGGLVLLREDAALPLSARSWPVPAGAPVGTLVPAGRNGAVGGFGNAALRFVELRSPAEAEWTIAADELVERAATLREQGAAGVLLRPGAASQIWQDGAWWDGALRHASRIRTEAAIPVAICVPADWAFDLPRDANADAWPARIHMALISGRVDLVTPWK